MFIGEEVDVLDDLINRERKQRVVDDLIDILVCVEHIAGNCLQSLLYFFCIISMEVSFRSESNVRIALSSIFGILLLIFGSDVFTLSVRFSDTIFVFF